MNKLLPIWRLYIGQPSSNFFWNSFPFVAFTIDLKFVEELEVVTWPLWKGKRRLCCKFSGHLREFPNRLSQRATFSYCNSFSSTILQQRGIASIWNNFPGRFKITFPSASWKPGSTYQQLDKLTYENRVDIEIQLTLMKQRSTLSLIGRRRMLVLLIGNVKSKFYQSIDFFKGKSITR